MNLADLHRIAAAYPSEAAHTLADERERYFTTAQRAAWDLRFGTSRQDRRRPAALFP